MPLANPEQSGFLIYDITGLGPPKATINTSRRATSDGVTYNSSNVAERNIVIMAKFQELPTIEDTRQKSYKYFPIGKRVKLVIETDNRLCEVEGYVESNEPVIFSEEEYSQISIICPESYLTASGEEGTIISVMYGTTPMFEFPFSNENETEKLIEFGSLNSLAEYNINYTGDANVGIIINIKAYGLVNDLTIYNTNTREIMRISTVRLTELTGYPIMDGDEIVISTISGKKSITLIRGGISLNILGCLDRFSNWFTLSKGDNIFAYSAGTGGENVLITVTNSILYEGV